MFYELSFLSFLSLSSFGRSENCLSSCFFCFYCCSLLYPYFSGILVFSCFLSIDGGRQIAGFSCVTDLGSLSAPGLIQSGAPRGIWWDQAWLPYLWVGSRGYGLDVWVPSDGLDTGSSGVHSNGRDMCWTAAAVVFTLCFFSTAPPVCDRC